MKNRFLIFFSEEKKKNAADNFVKMARFVAIVIPVIDEISEIKKQCGIFPVLLFFPKKLTP